MLAKPRPLARHRSVPVAVLQTGLAPRTTSIATSRAIVWLSAIIVALALVAALTGLFWGGGNGPATSVSSRGESVELYASGLYRYDPVFKGGANKGTDVATIAIGVPLLIIATWLYRRGSLRGHLLLTGTLVWFLYAYASLALSAAYNELFLVYVVLFSASLFAFILVFSSIDRAELATSFSTRLPRRAPGIFMIVSGLVPFIVWLQPLLGAMARGEPPELLDNATTMVTEVLDLGIIVPAAILSGVLILRRAPLGYLMAFSLLIIEIMLAPMIAAQTAFQIEAGISFTTPMIVGPIGGFVTISILGIWIIARLLRAVTDPLVEPRRARPETARGDTKS